MINGPLATTHLNVNTEDTSTNLDDAQDIGVVGKGKYKIQRSFNLSIYLLLLLFLSCLYSRSYTS